MVFGLESDWGAALISDEKLTELEQKLAYQFNDRSLLEEAVTHPSFSKKNNQRLEFLGDALLGCIISALLFEKHQRADEGELTRLRAHLVQKRTLSKLAKSMDLSHFLVVGSSFSSAETLSDSVHADAFEALVAAVFADGGFDRAVDFVASCYDRYHDQGLDVCVSKDPKTALQEFCQKNRYALPDYRQSAVSQQSEGFHICVEISELSLSAQSYALTKRQAQSIAAEKLLEQLLKRG